ncbi:phosphotransferase [Streptomyces lydicus]|uniref:phosphotransferase n=1 Tax=Streptomyces lydicus TaxID=47763 RepID=UPI0037B8B804
MPSSTGQQRISIPGRVLDWASCVIGAITVVRDASGRRTNSKVWELTSVDGARFFLKISPSKVAHDREVHAYQFAVPALGLGRAPRLQAADPAQMALLLTSAPGQRVANTALGMSSLIRVHRQVGYLLRELHDAQVASSKAKVDAVAEVRARTASAAKGVAAAGDLLSRAEQELVLRLARELPHLEACPTAFVHGDAQEGNVLWDGASGCAALLDFAQARPSVAVVDFVRPSVGRWTNNPRLRRAFFTGYGRELTGAERKVLPALAAVDAVESLLRGVRMRDSEATERARLTLKLLAGCARP